MKVHGVYKLWAANNIIYAQAQNSWNREAAEHFANSFKKQVKEQTTGAWGHAVYLDDWELGTPDIEPIIQELTQWCIDNGMICAAQIFSPSMVKRYQMNKMVTEQSGNFTRKQFTHEHDALEWLTEQGFEVIDESELAIEH